MNKIDMLSIALVFISFNGFVCGRSSSMAEAGIAGRQNSDVREGTNIVIAILSILGVFSGAIYALLWGINFGGADSVLIAFPGYILWMAGFNKGRTSFETEPATISDYKFQAILVIFSATSFHAAQYFF